MTAIGKMVRWCFGALALCFGAAVVYLPFVLSKTSTLDSEDLARYSHVQVGAAIMCLVFVATAVVLGMAWWTLRKGKRSAHAWAIVASVFCLPLLPIGTVIGIAGLVVFSRGETATQLVEPPKQKAPRLPGDGTSKFLEAITGGAAIVGTLVVNSWWAHWGVDHGLTRYGIVRFLVELEIASLLSTAFHEAGHVAGGWASAMKLRHFVVGPLDWRMRDGKWEFKFNHASPFALNGSTAMVPTSLKNIRGQRVFLAAAGPVASLLLGVIALLATLTAKGQWWEPAWELCSLIATLSTLNSVINLVSVRPQDQYSDGAHIYQIISGGPWADVHIAFSMVASSLVTPLRPRDFDIGILRRAGQFLTQGREAMLLRLFAYMHYADSGQIREALQARAEAEAIYPEVEASLPAELHCGFVFSSALFRRDACDARRWWQRMEAKKITRFDSDYWSARTALLWIENQTAEARRAWETGNAIAQNLPSAGAYEFDRWCYAQLRQVLDATTPPPLPEPAMDDVSVPVAG
jgi:hypothetical protein